MKKKLLLLIILALIGIGIFMFAKPYQFEVSKYNEDQIEGLTQQAGVNVNEDIERGLTWNKICEGDICDLETHLNHPINYYEEKWKPINATIVPSDNPLYDYEVEKGLYKVYFKSDPTEAETVRYETNEGYFTFQPFSLNYRNALNQLQQINTIQEVIGEPINHIFLTETKYNLTDTLLYKDAFGYNTNLTYRYGNQFLKLKLYVEPDNLPEPEEYITDQENVTLDIDFLIDYPNDIDIYVEGELWDKQTTKRTKEKVLFKKGNEIVFFLPSSKTCESFHWVNNSGVQNCTTIEYEFKKQGSKLHLLIKTNYTFLINPELHSPFEIDPNIQVTLDNNASDAQSAGTNCDTFDNDSASYLVANTILPIGCATIPTGWVFEDVNVPANADIISSNVSWSTWATCGGGSCEINIYGIVDDDISVWEEVVYEPEDATKTGNYTDYIATMSDAFNGVYTTRKFNMTYATQEMVNDVGWDSGDNMGFITNDNGSTGRNKNLMFYTADADSGNYPHPVLDIEYISADTCTYSSGNWEVECSDNCNISVATDVLSNDLILNGSGIFRINADIINITEIIKDHACEIIKHQGYRLG